MNIQAFDTNRRYQLRILTEPYQGVEHSVHTGLGHEQIRCAVPSYHDGECALCKLANRPYRFWLVGAIDRLAGNEYGVYRLDYQDFGSLRQFAINPDVGNPMGYDITITKPAFNALPKAPLTAQEQQVKDNVDTNFLIAQTNPALASCVRKFADKHSIGPRQ